MRRKKTPEQARVHYIKLSLTKSELIAITELSADLNNTVAGTVRELITITTNLSIHAGDFIATYENLDARTKKVLQTIEEELTPEQIIVKNKIFNYILIMNKFSKKWEQSDIKSRFIV